jgi:phage tail sheath protein FI
LLHIAAVAPADAAAGGHVAAIAGLAATDAAIIAAPDVQAVAPGVADAAMQALVALAGEADRNCFAIVDPPAGLTIDALTDWRAVYDSADAALYWPWLQLPDGLQLPPSAWVAGVMAATDRTRGVWKAPANVAFAGVAAMTVLTAAQEDLLTPDGINTLRALPGRGLLIRGARTLSRDPEWRYVPVRRLAAMVSASVARGLGWAVFEPQGAPLWAQARALVEDFLQALWRDGALAGNTPDEAFFVRCDAATMTAADIAEARLIVQIGFAPLRPAEFSILRIAVRTAA